MNIQEILAKTKKKSEAIVTNRKPPSIATEFRPYDADAEKLLASDSLQTPQLKPITNQKQTDNKPKTKLTTNQEQTDNKPTTEIIAQIKTGNKPIAKLATEATTNWKQTDNKPTAILDLCTFSSMTGIQRAILLFLYEECKTQRSTCTREMSLEHILRSLNEVGVNTTPGSIKTSLQRLEKKNALTRKFFKNGRGGWSIYELSDSIYRDIMAMYEHGFRNKPTTNWQQTGNKLTSELITKVATATPSSSSLDQTTTITNKPEKTSLPIEWQEIDFEPLEKIRFHKGHVEQLFKHGLEFQPVQESIYHFSFDLTTNNKGKDIKTDSLGFFMGIMKRSGYYAAPENYESPQEQGRRLFLEQEAKKAQKKLQAEKELMMSYFELWVNQFTEQEKIDLVGKTELGPNRTMLTTGHKLVMYYKNTIWPEQYKKMVEGGA